MPQPPASELKKIVRQVEALANKKFGKDWSLVISHEGGSMQIEARHNDGKLAQAIVWINGRIENRTCVSG
jgi:hypothetical protein